MKELMPAAIVIMIFVIIFQIAKASEYVSVLKGEEKSNRQNNKINAFLLISFLIVGLIGAWWCNDMYYKQTLFPQGSASKEGISYDNMFLITTIITGIVFVITQVGLFWFSFKYQAKEGKKVYFFPHSTKLELIWTVIPAITLTALVAIGLFNWFKLTSDAPKNAAVVEITGHQFAWEIRYPGKDGVFGKKDYKLTTSQNSLGVDFNDPASRDDIRGVQNEMYLVVNKPAKLVINAQDVIHDVGLSHFRMKMDAVPGIPTTMWFTPIVTTKDMKLKTNNPNFEYEISCDQMCGAGHFNMKGIIKVVTQEEYDAWAKTQKPEYWTINPAAAPPVTDTVKTNVTAQVVTNKK